MASTKKVGDYDWPVPLQGVTPWDGLADSLFNQVGADLKLNKTGSVTSRYPQLIQWGDFDTGNYIQANDNADAKVAGAWDRQNLPWKNLTVEVATKPGTPTVGRLLVDDDKLWFAGKGTASPVWSPLTRPALTVEPAAAGSRQSAEFITIDAAIAALPAAGGTILLMPGTYAITTVSVLPTTGVRIIGMGDGVVIDFSAATAAYGLRILDAKDVEIVNCRFTGAAAKNAIRIESATDGATARVAIRNCRFDTCVNAIEFLENVGDKEVLDVVIEDCEFLGTNAICENAIYSETEIERVTIRRCRFEGWGQAGTGQSAIDLDGNVGAGPVYIDDCKFKNIGNAVTEHAIDVSALDDTSISNCYFHTIGGSAIKVDTVSRPRISNCTVHLPSGSGIQVVNCDHFLLSDCVIYDPDVHGVEFSGTTNYGVCEGVLVSLAGASGSGFKLDQVDDSVFSGCQARGGAGNGWEIGNCDRDSFDGCRADNNTLDGFRLLVNTYLSFNNCYSRGNTGDDVEIVTSGTVNSHLGFVIQDAAVVGTVPASNGVTRTYSIPLTGWTAVQGTPVQAEVGTTNRVGWSFDGVATVEEIAGAWVVPEHVSIGSILAFRPVYVGVAAPSANTVTFKMNVLDVTPGTTLITAAGASLTAASQTMTTANRLEKVLATAMTTSVGAAAETLLLRLQRDPVDAGDTYGSDLFVVALEVEVTISAVVSKP